MISEKPVADAVASISRVLSAVHLDNKPAFATDKINDVRPYWLLTHKFAPANRSGTQAVPQLEFSIGGLATKSPSP
jgi:hypothetical protein